jgi:drug/metabolite transporter (DMT)-like permease
MGSQEPCDAGASARDASVLPYCWMLAGSLAFTVMASLAHELGSRCDWQVIALARSGLPLVFAATLALASGARLVFWRPRTLWMRSIAGSISLVSTFYIFTRLPVSDVLTLTNMFPIWVALLSWPLLREPPSGEVWISVACGVLGVILIQQPHLATGNRATLIGVGSSLCTAIAMLGLHRLHYLDPWAIVVHFSGVSLVFCLIAFLVFDRSRPVVEQMSAGAVLMLFGVGVTATAGQLCLTKAFATGSPAKVSVVGLSQVAMAMLADALFFGRSFGLATVLGIALIIGPTSWLLTFRAR